MYAMCLFHFLCNVYQFICTLHLWCLFDKAINSFWVYNSWFFHFLFTSYFDICMYIYAENIFFDIQSNLANSVFTINISTTLCILDTYNLTSALTFMTLMEKDLHECTDPMQYLIANKYLIFITNNNEKFLIKMYIQWLPKVFVHFLFSVKQGSIH